MNTTEIKRGKLSGHEGLDGLAIQYLGEDLTCTALAGAGSDRRYYRYSAPDGKSVIGTVGDDVAENRAFIELSESFNISGCNVPRVLGVTPDGKAYLQTDLGDVSLLKVLGTDARMPMSRMALDALIRMQTVPARLWCDKTFPKPFSTRQVMWDLNYFKYEFLKPAGVVFDEDELENDFERFAKRLVSVDTCLWGFMYRDFQSRNVMVFEGGPWLIDFQGGRYGPMPYDVASFLWQAKAGFSARERGELLRYYAEKLSAKTGVDVDEIIVISRTMALFRTLQVLGAYGFRGLVEKKAHFIESIPAALANLADFTADGSLDNYRELKSVAVKLCASRFAQPHNKDGLTVKVFSFSYKKGYPEDLTGNGGGFMFDCRGMANPGRYDEYKPLTGLDAPVRKFLEDKGEVQRFVDNALAMAEPSAVRYSERGFSSLQVGFGCTGGRHRSVYCADRFARMLAQRHPDIRVELIHREQGVELREFKELRELREDTGK